MFEATLCAATGGVLFLIGIACVIKWSYIVAQPDEWLLRIRDGKLVNAGIGISLFRRPGDVVARFTSTVQRVKFSADATTRDHLPVKIDGFVLWSISPVGENPFVAFSKLGIANLDSPPADLKSRKHLLTTAQYHAFQALLDAAVQGFAGTLTLSEILADQRALLDGIAARLDVFAETTGIEMDRVEVLEVRPADATILKDLAAEQEQTVREAATHVRVATAERLKEQELASASRLRQKELASEREQRLAKLEADRLVSMRQAEVERELLAARQEREERELAAKLDRLRREAEAQRDGILAVSSAEEKKSQAVRDHELGRLVAEKLAQAVSALPLHEARWISVGPDSPVSSLAGLLAGAREMLLRSPSRTEPERS